ncbi:hypothetical protein ACL02U_24785 [Streptomyces sp. MS06]|uniref:Rv1733c family protein n=1 Tax=Streptomyces sp. MS06 TaxID=3385974 RepID=UPI00399F2510
MRRTKRTRATGVRGWRWRSNSLRRRSDRVEAWIVLLVWIAALLGAPAAGAAAATAVGDDLAARRAASRPVAAVLTQDAGSTPALATGGTSQGKVWSEVRWTAPDGAVHTGLAKAEPGSPAGTRVTVWTDAGGALVRNPPSALEAQSQSVLIGAAAAITAATAAAAAGRLARAGLDRRRLREWGAEWARVGPRWRKEISG